MNQNFSSVIQIGVVVPDAQATAEHLRRFLGWESQRTWETSRVPGRIYHGQPADFACRMVFFQLPGIEIEIIQPLSGPSCWQDYLDANGCGIHHLLFDVADSEKRYAWLHENGIDVEQRGRALPYGEQVHWSYVNSNQELGFTMELTNRREFPRDLPAIPSITGQYASLLSVSVVVSNLDQSMRKWNSILGWQPESQPYRIYGDRYLGAESNALTGGASYRLPNLVVELVRPACGKSCAKDYLSRHGEGIFCITLALENREALRSLVNAGLAILEQGHSLRQDQLSCWTMLDTKAIFGFYLAVVYP